MRIICVWFCNVHVYWWVSFIRGRYEGMSNYKVLTWFFSSITKKNKFIQSSVLLLLQVFQRERLNGHYGVTAFVISNTLSAMPFLILITFISGTVCYFMVRLHPGFMHYLFFVLCLYASVTVVESLMMAIASVVPNFLMGIIIGAGIQVKYCPSLLSFPSYFFSYSHGFIAGNIYASFWLLPPPKRHSKALLALSNVLH